MNTRKVINFLFLSGFLSLAIFNNQVFAELIDSKVNQPVLEESISVQKESFLDKSNLDTVDNSQSKNYLKSSIKIAKFGCDCIIYTTCALVTTAVVVVGGAYLVDKNFNNSAGMNALVKNGAEKIEKKAKKELKFGLNKVKDTIKQNLKSGYQKKKQGLKSSYSKNKHIVWPVINGVGVFIIYPYIIR